MKIILLLIILVYAGPTFSQSRATLSDGRKVELHENGTWKFVSTESGIATKDCRDLDITVDKFDGDTTVISQDFLRISSPDGSVEMKFLHTYFQKYRSCGYALYYTAISNCVDKESKIVFLLEDDSKVELENDLPQLNCKGEMQASFKDGEFNNLSKMYLLSTKKVKSIRIRSYTSNVDVDLGPAEQNKFLERNQCVFAPILRRIGGN